MNPPTAIGLPEALERAAGALPRDADAIRPAFEGIYNQIDYSYAGAKQKRPQQSYVSNHGPFLEGAGLKDFLTEHGLLEKAETEAHPAQRYWPGDR